MGGPSINDSQVGSGGVYGPGQLPPDVGVLPPGVQNQSGISTLSKSEQEAIFAALNVGLPSLMPPWIIMTSWSDFFGGGSDSNSNSQTQSVSGSGGVDKGVAILAFQNQYAAIVNKVLEKWGDSIAAENQRRKDEINSPEYQAQLKANQEDILQSQQLKMYANNTEYWNWFNNQPPSVQNDELQRVVIPSLRTQVLESYMLNQGQSINASVDPTSVGSLPFITSTLLVGASIPQANVIAPNDQVTSNSIGNQLFQDANNQALLMIPSDARAELGLLGAWYMYGTMFSATVGTLGSAASAGQPPLDIDTARQFAGKIIDLTNNPGFNNVILALLAQKTDEGVPLNADQQNRLVSLVKLSLLTTALAVVYKVETGGLTGNELLAMIEGRIEVPAGDIKEKLVNMIKNLFVGLTDSDIEFLKNSIVSFFNSGTKLDDLLQPMKVVNTMFSGQSLEEEHMDQNRV